VTTTARVSGVDIRSRVEVYLTDYLRPFAGRVEHVRVEQESSSWGGINLDVRCEFSLRGKRYGCRQIVQLFDEWVSALCTTEEVDYRISRHLTEQMNNVLQYPPSAEDQDFDPRRYINIRLSQVEAPLSLVRIVERDTELVYFFDSPEGFLGVLVAPPACSWMQPRGRHTRSMWIAAVGLNAALQRMYMVRTLGSRERMFGQAIHDYLLREDSINSAIADATLRTREMHLAISLDKGSPSWQQPQTDCQYWTKNFHLPCAVNPTQGSCEGCSDFTRDPHADH